MKKPQSGLTSKIENELVALTFRALGYPPICEVYVEPTPNSFSKSLTVWIKGKWYREEIPKSIYLSEDVAIQLENIVDNILIKIEKG